MLNSARASFALALSILAAPRPVPRELSTLAARARLSSEILAWCKGEFRARQRGGYAVAIRSVDTAGRYVVVEATGTIDELAPFADAPDLACYTAAGARELNATMQRSETISGRLTPRWRTTVVCGFTDATTAACWQYSPVEKKYVSVGGMDDVTASAGPRLQARPRGTAWKAVPAESGSQHFKRSRFRAR